MEGPHCLAGLLSIDAVDVHKGNGGVELGQDGEQVLKQRDLFRSVGLIVVVVKVQLGKGLPFTDQLRQLQNTRVQAEDGVPGPLADDAVCVQVKDGLESPDAGLGLRPEDSVHAGNLGNGWVGLGDAVQGELGDADIPAPVPQAHGRAGIGILDVLHRGVDHQLDVGAVVVFQNLHGGVTILGQGFAAPLGQAVALGGGAVAEPGGQRLHIALAADVVVKQLIHQLADAVKEVPPLDELLVIGGGGGDVEVVAPAGVVLRVNPVQGEGHLSQDVGPQGGVVPGGVNLAGGYVFDVVLKGHGDVFRVAGGGAHVNGDVGWNVRGNGNGHESPPFLQVLRGNVHLTDLRGSVVGQGDQGQILHADDPRKDLYVPDDQQLIAPVLHPEVTQGEGGGLVRGLAVRQDRGVDGDGHGVSAAVAVLDGQQTLVGFVPVIHHGDEGVLNGKLPPACKYPGDESAGLRHKIGPPFLAVYAVSPSHLSRRIDNFGEIQ